MELPKPPSGYTWQDVPELKAAFLMPSGWFFQREEQKGTLAYLITKETIKDGGGFQTGLTVNVFHLKKDSAVDRGQTLISNMAKKHGADVQSRSFGAFREFASQFKDTDATGTIGMYTLAIANPKTNTLYLFIFESPEAGWESAWKLGKPILDMLAIDDEM
jgi:hypothetical protein